MVEPLRPAPMTMDNLYFACPPRPATKVEPDHTGLRAALD